MPSRSTFLAFSRQIKRSVLSILIVSLIGVVGGWMTSPAHATPLVQSGGIHTVARGETLFSIAQQYGTSVEGISAANGITNPSAIYAGQQLVIPSSSASVSDSGGTHIVAPGENLYRIALRYGTTVPALARLNGISDAHQVVAGQRLRIPGRAAASPAIPQPSPVNTTTRTHIVQPGETLAIIATRYTITTWALIQANEIHNPALIYPGQVLTVPGAAHTPAHASPPTGGGQRIVVDLSEQRLYAYQGEVLVYAFVASTGMPDSPTQTGHFSVLNKLPNAYASTWNLEMPYWMGIYWSGGLQNGIHALPILSNGQQLWAGYLGSPVSFGCVVLSVSEARALYEWAAVGTPVVIQP